MHSAYPDRAVIRPRLLPVLLITGAVAALAAVVVAGAFRTGQPLAAWFGAAMALGCVALADFLLRTIQLTADAVVIRQPFRAIVLPFDTIRAYGLRRSWSYRSGRWTYLTVFAGDTRVDVPIDYFRRNELSALLAALAERAGPAREDLAPPSIDWTAVVCAVGASITIGVSLLCAGLMVPSTLLAERLFSEGASVGLIVGFALGVMLARALGRAPLSAGALMAMTLLMAAGAATLILNAAGRGTSAHTVPVAIEARRWFSDHGRRIYVVDALIDGAPKRLYPDEAEWERLRESNLFSGCVRGGRLGFSIIVRVTHPCGAAGAAR